jgi:hypothetical protein
VKSTTKRFRLAFRLVLKQPLNKRSFSTLETRGTKPSEQSVPFSVSFSPMDMKEMIKSFGGLTGPEITAGCHILDPKIDSYEAARMWLWIVIRRLVDAKKFKAAQTLVQGLNWSQECKDITASMRDNDPDHRITNMDRFAMEWL